MIYMPPEAFDDATVDDPNYIASAWDIYALGVIMHELWYELASSLAGWGVL